jgi:sensor histidine kinase YesM
LTPPKQNWALSFLWINFAVAVVLLIQIAGHQISSFREFLRALVYVLVYANLAGALGVFLIGGLVERPGPILRKFRLVPVVAVTILVFSAVGCLLAQTLFMVTGFLVPKHFWPEYFYTVRVAIPLALVFGLGALAHASSHARVRLMEERLHEKEITEERARKLAAEAQLRSLESRIHPHFLFNALNSISSLIGVNPSRAEQMVGQLASLLRASLDTSNQPLIPLRQELAIVESYIDIEKVRFGNKLRSSVNVPADLHDAKVPPMSIQSLVENAVKHGVTQQIRGGDALVIASAGNGTLRIEVCDSGPGFDLAAIRSGHGLDNLVERLDALFGANARLNVVRRDDHCVVEMVLPLP